MQKDIAIDKTALIERVRLTLAYYADRNPALQDRYKDAVMTTDDSALVTNHWVAALKWVAIGLQRYGGDIQSGDTGITLNDLSEYSLAAKTSVLESAVTMAVESKLVAEWMAVIGDTNNQEQYQRKALANVTEAIDLCNRRTRPTPT